MNKLASLSTAWALAACVPIGVIAAGTPAAVTLDDQGRAITRAQPSARAAAGPFHRVAGTVIYDNFSTGKRTYSSGIGWTLVSAGAGFGFVQAAAMPFTPATDTTLETVQLAISLTSGTDMVRAVLMDDAGGIPGNRLGDVKVDNLFAYKTCCATETVRGHGVPLQGGKTYWIAVRATGNTFANWNWVNTDSVGPIALDAGSGWVASTDTQGAFAVIGD